MDNDVLTTLKILIIGESGVGKSRYKNRFGVNGFRIRNMAVTNVYHNRGSLGIDLKSHALSFKSIHF